MRRTLLAAAAALVIGAGSLTACSSQSSTTNAAGSRPDPSDYTAVVDSGSNGSRMFLYANASTESATEVELEYSFDPKAGSIPGFAGLASYAADPSAAGPSGIAPLLAGLTTYLDQNSIPKSEVPVSVMATAGMRELDQVNPQAVTAIYASVSETVSASGFPIGEVGTISGQREGLYSWADVNYGLGTFGSDKPAEPRGIVEVGGASA